MFPRQSDSRDTEPISMVYGLFYLTYMLRLIATGIELQGEIIPILRFSDDVREE